MDITAPEHRNPSRGQGGRLVNLALLVCIVVVGVAVRFHNIGLESIDLEEYACVGGVGAPTWRAFFEGQRVLYPYGAPLAPSLIYLWTRLTGPSIVAVRVLFAAVSSLSIVICYWLGLVFFRNRGSVEKKRAGLVVALCFALSPVHVFHAQEARMYALVSLFALLAAAGLVQGLDTGKARWWALHLVATVGLVASHYFTVFLLPVLGLALLLRERRLSGRLLLWSLAQGLLLVVLLLWVSRIPRQAEDLYSYYGMPNLKIIAAHLFAGDSTTLSANSFFPSDLSWDWLPGGLAAKAREAHVYVDAALIALSLAAMVGAVGMLLHRLRRGDGRDAWSWAVLLLWAFLPTAVMLTISVAWQPVYGSRYVMYSAFAWYLLFGGLAARLCRGRRYYGVLAVLALLFGYQLALALPPQTRTAWRASLERVREQSSGQPVLLLEDPFWLPVLQMNDDPDTPLPVAAAFSRDSLCEAAAFLKQRAGGAEEVWVLLVLTTDFDETPFAHCLENHALSYERRPYPGERRLSLYRVVGGTASVAGVSEPVLYAPLVAALQSERNASAVEDFRKRVRYMPDHERGFWLRLGVVLALHGLDGLAGDVLAHGVEHHGMAAVEVLNLADELSVALDGTDLIAAMARHEEPGRDVCSLLLPLLRQVYYDGDMVLLESLGRAAVDAAPQCAEGSAFIGLALQRREAHREALDWFARAREMNPALMPEVAEAHGMSLAAAGAGEEALELLREALSIWPEYHWLYMRTGDVHAQFDQHREAAAAYRRALEFNQEDSFIHYQLMQSLLALQWYREALPSAQHPAVAARDEYWVHLARWRVFVGADRHEDAEAVLRYLVGRDAEFNVLYEPLYGNPDPGTARILLREAREEDAPLVRELAIAVAYLEESRQ